MSLDWRLIAAYLVNVIVLFIVLRKILYKPVKKFLDEREARYARRAEDIERRDHGTQLEKAKYTDLLALAGSESDALIRDARSAANRTAEEIIARAQAEADDYIRRARKEIADERRLARKDMRDEIVDLAVDMASRILEREVSAEDHKRIVDRFLNNERVG